MADISPSNETPNFQQLNSEVSKSSPFQIKESDSSNFISKVKLAWRSLFVEEQVTAKAEKSTDPHVVDKIERLHKVTDKTLKNLKQLREDLKKELDPELMAHVEIVVHSIIRQISSIKNHSQVENKHSFEKYEEWEACISTLSSNTKDKKEMIKAVITNIINKSNMRIEKDLQVVENYLEQRLDSLPDTKKDVRNLRKYEEFNGLKSHIEQLKALKWDEEAEVDDSEGISLLQRVTDWTKEVDKQREFYQNAMFHQIDNLIDSTPADSAKNKNDEDM